MGNIIEGYDQASMTRGNISEQMKSNAHAEATPSASSATHARQRPGQQSSAAPFNQHSFHNAVIADPRPSRNSIDYNRNMHSQNNMFIPHLANQSPRSNQSHIVQPIGRSGGQQQQVPQGSHGRIAGGHARNERTLDGTRSPIGPSAHQMAFRQEMESPLKHFDQRVRPE